MDYKNIDSMLALKRGIAELRQQVVGELVRNNFKAESEYKEYYVKNVDKMIKSYWKKRYGDKADEYWKNPEVSNNVAKSKMDVDYLRKTSLKSWKSNEVTNLILADKMSEIFNKTGDKRYKILYDIFDGNAKELHEKMSPFDEDEEKRSFNDFNVRKSSSYNNTYYYGEGLSFGVVSNQMLEEVYKFGMIDLKKQLEYEEQQKKTIEDVKNGKLELPKKDDLVNSIEEKITAGLTVKDNILMSYFDEQAICLRNMTVTSYPSMSVRYSKKIYSDIQEIASNIADNYFNYQNDDGSIHFQPLKKRYSRDMIVTNATEEQCKEVETINMKTYSSVMENNPNGIPNEELVGEIIDGAIKKGLKKVSLVDISQVDEFSDIFSTKFKFNNKQFYIKDLNNNLLAGNSNDIESTLLSENIKSIDIKGEEKFWYNALKEIDTPLVDKLSSDGKAVSFKSLEEKFQNKRMNLFNHTNLKIQQLENNGREV